MARRLRVGGRGTTPSGGSVVWSVAEGSRGRRWREVVRAGEGIGHSLLLETDPGHRFRHLELGTPAGLLTLHPEPDGTLHGHAVVSEGVRAVEGLPGDEEGIVALDGSVVCVLAAAALLRGSVAADASRAQQAVQIPPSLRVAVGLIQVSREAGGAWQVGAGPALGIDHFGLPELTDGASWELETEPA